MKPYRLLFPNRGVRLAKLCLALLVVTCGAVIAQDAEDVGLVPETGLPRWMPRPSRYLDRPMTEAEYNYCRQRTDIPKLGPHGHPAGDLPPAPRCLLDEAVSVEVNGTVVEAVRALMGQTNREWLVSIRGDSADKVAQFTVQDASLWQALDKLLEVYGYDWGFLDGAVVCWPALIPERPRPATPEGVPDADAEPSDAAPLSIPEPTPIDTVLDRFRPARYPLDGGITHLNRRVVLDARLRDWQLVGRVASGGTGRGVYQLAAALPAVVEGPPLEGCISMGAHMWLDRAMRGADALAAELKTQGIEITARPRYYIALVDRLRAMLTAQQWALMDVGGQAVIWFRDLPLDVAQVWVLTARVGEEYWGRSRPAAGETPLPGMPIDWSRPEDFFAVAYYADEVQKSPEDGFYRVVGRHPSVGAAVPMKAGGWRAI